jgi:hypothetical protein
VSAPSQPPGQASPYLPQGASDFIQGISYNFGQQIIVIAEDRVRLCLHDCLPAMARRRDWITWLSLLATLLLTEATAAFKDVYGVSRYTWEAVFMVLTAGAIALLGYSLISLLWHKAVTIEGVLSKLRGQGYTYPTANQ